MKSKIDPPAASRRRRLWGKRIIVALLLAATSTALFMLVRGPALQPVTALEQQSTTSDAEAQPMGTPPAGMVPPGGKLPKGMMPPGMPITATRNLSGTMPSRPDSEGNTSAPEPTATATPALPPAHPVGITAVVGENGATLQLLDDANNVTMRPVGSRVRLVGRSDDGAWLVCETDAGSAWVSSADVIAFNLDRLEIVDALPPRRMLASTLEPTEATTVTAAVTTTATTTTLAENETSIMAPSVLSDAVAAAVPAGVRLDALLDTNKARGLNIRSGPGVGYLRMGTVVSGEALIATGRNEAGDWLYIERAGDALSGWAAADYLLLGGDLNALPVINTVETVPQTAVSIRLNNATLATSGTDYRWWQQRPGVSACPANRLSNGCRRRWCWNCTPISRGLR